MQKRHKTNTQYNKRSIHTSAAGSRGVSNADLMSHGVASSRFFKSGANYNNQQRKPVGATQLKNSVDRAQMQSIMESLAGPRNVRTSQNESRPKYYHHQQSTSSKPQAGAIILSQS